MARLSVKVNKSTRHSKITGDFAEYSVLYWLSKHGFECARVDHTGIDIIAKNPITKELMGISVKSRSRNTGKEGQYVSIPNGDFTKAKRSCKVFGCIPYFVIQVDQGDTIWVFVLSTAHLLDLYPKGETKSGWKMTEKHLAEYVRDPEIVIIEIKHKILRWWKSPPHG